MNWPKCCVFCTLFVMSPIKQLRRFYLSLCSKYPRLPLCMWVYLEDYRLGFLHRILHQMFVSVLNATRYWFICIYFHSTTSNLYQAFLQLIAHLMWNLTPERWFGNRIKRRRSQEVSSLWVWEFLLWLFDTLKLMLIILSLYVIILSLYVCLQLSCKMCITYFKNGTADAGNV